MTNFDCAWEIWGADSDEYKPQTAEEQAAWVAALRQELGLPIIESQEPYS